MLIVGGYGTFGGRLARLLADQDGLTLLIAGRSLEKAQQFCRAELGRRVAGGAASADSGASVVSAQLCAVRFDRDAHLDSQLRALAPDIVVDASGPFQAYGDRPYRLVEACVECGIDYLDLADSTEFVCGIGQFDERAQSRGVFVLSGVSTCPVLTSAAARLLATGLSRVDSISAGIAPSPHAKVGLNVVRAIAGYAGKPVRLRAGSGERVGYALTETMRYMIAPLGGGSESPLPLRSLPPLRPITFSLVDVPDLRLLAELWPECRSVWVGAGPTPAVWHGVLRALAWLVRLRVLPSLSFLAPLMCRAMHRWTWGEHRGGMFVRVEGVDAASKPVARSWDLIAEGDDGPFVPSMAAAAIVRKCLEGVRPVSGARPAVRELDIADYEPLIARRRIRFGMREDGDASRATAIEASPAQRL